jgi:tRNA A-37 threonylcarbamoyl transferase component Bud32
LAHRTHPADRWAQIERLLDEALALPADARASFVERNCGGDADLLREVSSLIDAVAASDGFLEPHAASAADPLQDAGATLASGSLIGAWAIQRLLGRGGMSEVYLAERADGQYTQRAALKLLSAALAQKPRQLREERQILARLEHPGITRLIDGGVADDGRPYLVMEYVEGQNLLAYCKAHAATLEQRLQIFLQICEAVAYAHLHLVVHRDLKPGNILVTGEGQVRLLDFGVAQLLGAPDLGGHGANPTLHLTPAYAAPEQLSGMPVTTATDTYSLGVLLYQLLCGRLPFELDTLPMTLALQRVLEDTPPLLSATARRQVAPPVPPAALAGDLEHIAGKALRKEPAQRYASAADLKADIERYLRHEPVTARGYEMGYVLARFVRRHRSVVTLALGAITALVLGLGLSLWFYADARRARNRAEAAAATTQAINDFLNRDLLAGIRLDTAPTRDVTLRQLLDDAARQVDARFAGQPETAARVHQAVAESYFNLSLYDAAQAQYQKALALYGSLQRRDSDEALAVIARLASLASGDGRYEQAVALYDEALRGYAARHGASYAPLAALRAESAGIHYGHGDFQRAADQLRQLLEGEAGRALSAADRLDSIATYGGYLQCLGDFAGAERAQREALAGRIKLYGEQHMATSMSHLFVGGVLTDEARLDEAEKELETGAAGVRRWVGPDDAFIATADSTLARLRLDQGRLAEAASLMRNALRIRVTAFGDDSSFTAWTRQQLAEVLQHQGLLREARQLMQNALAVADKTDGRGNPWTVRQRLVMVGILRELGETQLAQAELAMIPAGALSQLPATHQYVGLLRYEQGLVAAQAGDRLAARAALTQAAAIYTARYGAGHPRTRAVRASLAALS